MLKLIAIIAGIILAYAINIPCQGLEIGGMQTPTSFVYTYRADTKIVPWGSRIAFGLVAEGEYWKNLGKWKTESGIRCGAGKIYITTYLVKNDNDYYPKFTIGYYGAQRYGY